MKKSKIRNPQHNNLMAVHSNYHRRNGKVRSVTIIVYNCTEQQLGELPIGPGILCDDQRVIFTDTTCNCVSVFDCIYL